MVLRYPSSDRSKSPAAVQPATLLHSTPLIKIRFMPWLRHRHHGKSIIALTIPNYLSQDK